MPSWKVVAAMRDVAAVKGSAIRTMKEILYPAMMDVFFFAHSLDNVGRHFDTPTLDQFGQ